MTEETAVPPGGAEAPRLRLAVPAYREEARLPAYLPGLVAALADLPAEIVVVDDGSPPWSGERLRSALAPHLSPRVRLTGYARNRGKGGAIAFGLEDAAAEFLGFVDADGSLPAGEVRRLAGHALAHPGLDMVVGSRVKMLGRSIERRASRHYVGRVFATLVSGAFAAPVYDSQCGLKVFRAERYRAVRDAVLDDRWVWDTELLILFLRRGWRVEEFPVDWREVPGSKISVLRDGVRMWRSLARFRRTLA
jgi:dolichyl-phosphate beta-glucosyltransferase